MNKEKPKYIIPCKEEEANWTFYYKFCKKIHYHRIGEGYRHPHCSNEGYDEDYYLILEEETKQGDKDNG